MSSSPSSRPEPEAHAYPGGLRCDFCHEEVASVRRVALDQGYDRLLKPHVERYACARCSEQKERARLGLQRG